MQLPFSRAEFFQLFEVFNLESWPVLVFLFAVSAWAAVAIARARAPGRSIALVLAAHWLWSGLAFHLWFFTRINPTARLFALGFTLQGLLFLDAAARKRIAFARDASLRRLAGLLFLLASLLYPLLVLVDGHSLPAAPAFGVPCPTLLFTTGALLCATTPVSRTWLIVPIAWSLIGGSAAAVLGVTPDLLLIAAGGALSVLALPASVHRRLRRWFETPEQNAVRAA